MSSLPWAGLDPGGRGPMSGLLKTLKAKAGSSSLSRARERVAQNYYFAPFDWRVFVSEERSAFFAGVTEIQITNLDHPGRCP
jgi:hypothetical protein